MRTAFHHVAYRNLDICNALSWDSLKSALGHAGLKAGARVADIGCAYARTSILMAETFGAEATAVELDPRLAEEAKRLAAASAAPDKVTILNEASIDALRRLPPFDMILALGTTYPAGRDIAEPKDIFAELAKHILPGGCLVWGDLTWTAQPPEPLHQMVSLSGTYLDDSGWKQAARNAGLDIVSDRLSDADEWHHYRHNMEKDVADWLAAHPDHPDALAMEQANHRIRLMYDFGADCLGFGLYVFRRPV